LTAFRPLLVNDDDGRNAHGQAGEGGAAPDEFDAVEAGRADAIRPHKSLQQTKYLPLMCGTGGDTGTDAAVDTGRNGNEHALAPRDESLAMFTRPARLVRQILAGNVEILLSMKNFARNKFG
jgi:hypothetical protein